MYMDWIVYRHQRNSLSSNSMRWLIVIVSVVGTSLGLPQSTRDFRNEESTGTQDLLSRQRFCEVCPCGVANQWTRIVGGAETMVNEFPWVAALTVRGKLTCGATLISDLYLITAAHCVRKVEIRRELRVVLSEHNMLTSLESFTEAHAVSEILLHPGYEPRPDSRGRDTNDVALVKMVRPVRFRRGVLPVCLPPPFADFTHLPGTVSGWGATSEGGGAAAPVLAAVAVPILSRDECLTGSDYTPEEVTVNEICAGLPQGGLDACQGDSGGGLMVQDARRKWTIAGVVSWGEGCARPHAPGVHSRVASHFNWITTHTRDACFCI